MAALLVEAGIPMRVTERALVIDAILQRWRRRMSSRELGKLALRELALDLDLPQMDVLVATWAPSNEFGTEKGETMVSTIACRLNIDPSRASRLVSDLIGRGYLRRGVSQQDARRTIVELTEKGRVTVDAVRTIKFMILGDFLKGWEEKDIDTFLPLLDVFSDWVEESGQRVPTTMKPTFDELRAKIERAKAQD